VPRALSRFVPVVAISMGDPSGIGPEVLGAALTWRDVKRGLVPLVFGDASLARTPAFQALAVVAPEALGRVTVPTLVPVTRLAARERKPGKPTEAGGKAQYAYVQAAIAAAKAGLADALCTAPVSKEQISRAGIPFMGHTEVLADAFGCEVLMLMDGPRVRVALATNHLPIRALPDALTQEGLVKQLRLLSTSLAPLLGRVPRLGVCGLNPHAGEGGLLGREEVDTLAPAIARARALGVDCHGPLAADGLFAKANRMPYDAVLAMYHDQGLVAAKALDFEQTVNVTLGLPVPRTSPDHGVAYDLAGTGTASAVPMASALIKAAQLSRAAHPPSD